MGALLANWKTTLAPVTAYNYRSHLRKLLNFLEPLGAPHLTLTKLPMPHQRATVATEEELARLLRQPRPSLRLFILLYLQCGLRRSEIMAVTPRTWNPEQHTVTVRIKGGSIRTAQVTEDVEALFRAAGPDPDPDQSFVCTLHGKPITAAGMNHAWQAHRAKCHISNKVTAHDLRRSAATILYHATKDLRVPQQLLGHKSLSSTLRYLAPLAPAEARRYAELLNFSLFQPKEGDKPQ